VLAVRWFRSGNRVLQGLASLGRLWRNWKSGFDRWRLTFIADLHYDAQRLRKGEKGAPNLPSEISISKMTLCVRLDTVILFAPPS
jgi:hypothetical protein